MNTFLQEYTTTLIVLHIIFGFLHYGLVCAWAGPSLNSIQTEGRLYAAVFSLFGIAGLIAILSIIYEDRGCNNMWEAVKLNGFRL